MGLARARGCVREHAIGGGLGGGLPARVEWVWLSLRSLSAAARARIESPLGDDEGVGVVVDVREADPVLALSKEIDFKREL